MDYHHSSVESRTVLECGALTAPSGVFFFVGGKFYSLVIHQKQQSSFMAMSFISQSFNFSMQNSRDKWPYAFKMQWLSYANKTTR